ncbi:MAG: UDP-N-acetylmuramate--L-alanine ligase [Aggregatilineales bacterium]
MRFEDGQTIHIIGIGGFGMSAIARILLLRGFTVTGSDRIANHFTESLAELGATVYIGHDANHVNGADMVLATSAVPQDHVEIVAAKAQNIPVYKRSDILAPLMAGKTVIAVAGTHGKTTTTSMIVHILIESGLDPSYIVGGVMANTGTNAGVGQGDLFVIEADEYDNMFLGLKPDIAVITNIEWDHPDFFKTEADLIESFRKFAELLPNGGTMITYDGYPSVGVDPSNAIRQKNGDQEMRFVPQNIRTEPQQTVFDVALDGKVYRDLRLTLPGAHNIRNALSAIAACGLGITDGVCEALATFKTTGRRFDVCGEVAGVIVVDDYAHHPTAIKATLEATKARYPEHTLWGIWQPHTYSRTSALLEKYAQSFGAADKVIVTDIYAAREAPVEGVDGDSVAKAINHADVTHVSGLETLTEWLLSEVKAPSVVIIMSAGDAIQVSSDFFRRKTPPTRKEATYVDDST